MILNDFGDTFNPLCRNEGDVLTTSRALESVWRLPILDIKANWILSFTRWRHHSSEDGTAKKERRVKAKCCEKENGISAVISSKSQLCTRFVRRNRPASSVSATRHNPERGIRRTKHGKILFVNRGVGDPIGFEHAVPFHHGGRHIQSERVQDPFYIPFEIGIDKFATVSG